MKVIVFEPWYDDKHCEVLRALAEGIPDAEVRDVREYEPCDVAVIFGVVKKAYERTWSKQDVLGNHSGRSLLIVESAFVKRGEYYQVAWGGFAGHGDFRNEDMPRDRWDSFGVQSRPWQLRPEGPIVVCGQLPRDTTVQATDHISWCRTTVNHYRPMRGGVLFRPHPRVEDPGIYGIDEALIDTRPLDVVLDEAQAFVTFNSTAGVDAGIAGVPVVACDEGSMAWSIAAQGVGKPLIYPSRRAWLAGLGYSQWTLDEMRRGETWRHLTRPET